MTLSQLLGVLFHTKGQGFPLKFYFILRDRRHSDGSVPVINIVIRVRVSVRVELGLALELRLELRLGLGIGDIAMDAYLLLLLEIGDNLPLSTSLSVQPPKFSVSLRSGLQTLALSLPESSY
jgi:hypothetical protein